MDKSFKLLLPFVVFITGACVLIIEIVAMRILSPFFGNTIFTVSSVITVILTALSIGYYLGGKMADQKPSFNWFFSIILLSGIVLLFLHFLGIIALPIISSTLPITSGPLVAAGLLFFMPAFLLGMISPYAIKLQNINFPQEGIGAVSGQIFFWSTFGSIIGSLLSGFILIPLVGIDKIIIANGIILFFLGSIPIWFLRENKTRNVVSDLGLLAILIGMVTFALVVTDQKFLYRKDGVYEKITIYDGTYNGRPARFFMQDRSDSAAMFLDTKDQTDLVFNYCKYYAVYKVFTPEIRNALVIGGGGYSIPKALLAALPKAHVDVAEIEPLLFELAKKYFAAKDDPRLHVYTEDGRRFLHDTAKKYDLIFSDVYYSLFSIPPHFTTQEFFQVAKNKLDSKGIFIGNMIGSLLQQPPSFLLSEMKTFRSVFPNSYFFAVESPTSNQVQNIIFVGYNGDQRIDLTPASINKISDPALRDLLIKIVDPNKIDLSPYPILTDNYSPIEYLTGRTLQRMVSHKDS